MNHLEKSLVNGFEKLNTYYSQENLSNTKSENIYSCTIPETQLSCDQKSFWERFFIDTSSALENDYTDIKFSLRSKQRVKKFPYLSDIYLSELEELVDEFTKGKSIKSSRIPRILKRFRKESPSYTFSAVQIQCIVPKILLKEDVIESNLIRMSLNIKKFSDFCDLGKFALRKYKKHKSPSFHNCISLKLLLNQDFNKELAELASQNFLDAIYNIFSYNPEKDSSIQDIIYRNPRKLFYYFILQHILGISTFEEAFDRLVFALYLTQDKLAYNSFFKEKDIFIDNYSISDLLDRNYICADIENILLDQSPLDKYDWTQQTELCVDLKVDNIYKLILSSENKDQDTPRTVFVDQIEELKKLYIDDLHLHEWDFVINNPNLESVEIVDCILDPEIFWADNRYTLNLQNCKHLKKLVLDGIDLTKLLLVFSDVTIDELELTNCKFENFQCFDGSVTIKEVDADLKGGNLHAFYKEVRQYVDRDSIDFKNMIRLN